MHAPRENTPANLYACFYRIHVNCSSGENLRNARVKCASLLSARERARGSEEATNYSYLTRCAAEKYIEGEGGRSNGSPPPCELYTLHIARRTKQLGPTAAGHLKFKSLPITRYVYPHVRGASVTRARTELSSASDEFCPPILALQRCG